MSAPPYEEFDTREYGYIEGDKLLIVSEELSYSNQDLSDSIQINNALDDGGVIIRSQKHQCSQNEHRCQYALQQGKLVPSGFLLPIAIGNDGHDDIVADLSAMPHLLIGGCDGYGKTTFLQNAITSISRAGSSKFILVDSKDDDFKDYSNLDCLACPIIHDFDTLVEKLEWLIDELEWRYHLLANAGRRNIVEYNQNAIEKLPYLVLVIADYSAYDSPLRSDLFLNFFSRMCAKSKAAGIHIIISSEEIPESYIKNRFLCCFPARIAFRCESAVQSKALIGSDDATYLYYPGEVYYKQDFSSTSVRLQHYKD